MPRAETRSVLAHIDTSYVERSNLTNRMDVRRLTRLTNAFSKKLETRAHHEALMLTHYHFCRIHQTLPVFPAQAAGVHGRGAGLGLDRGIGGEAGSEAGSAGGVQKRKGAAPDQPGGIST